MIAHGALDYVELAAMGVSPEAVCDFSSNLNPFGPPPAVRAALAALDPAPYPDRSCQRLRALLAERHRCEPAEILAGNGSNELIHLLARALLAPGDTALVVGPTFGEYAHASALAGARVVYHERAKPPTVPPAGQQDDAWPMALGGPDLTGLLEQVERERPRLVWLCTPNNPTGTALAVGQLAALAGVCADAGGLLVLDRAYAAFERAADPQRDWLDGPAMPGLLRLGSLTKSYALAGLRLGYLLGPAALVARVARYQPTWSVSSAAQCAGLAALAAHDFLPTTLPRLWQASDDLLAGLRRLGLPVWRTHLPFLLVGCGDGAATRAALLRQGLAVRDCASFGLPAWVRVAPRREAENRRLLVAWEHLR